LQTLNGIARVTSITARGPPEPVYNLEVQVKHTYFVADSGVLVHNGDLCPKAQLKANRAKKGGQDYKKRVLTPLILSCFTGIYAGSAD
jgi:hypothetical protein